MKVEVNGKTYCVETLIADNERLRKEVIACAKTNRLVIDQIRAEIEDYITHSSYIKSFICCRLKDDVMQIIDKYRNEVSS